jgi:hypothetical protein
MSSRTLGAFFFLATLGGAFATSVAAGGCSDDEKTAPADAGSERGAPDANRPARPGDDAAPPKSCREECEEAHPTALPKDEAINSCWETFCGSPCIEATPPDSGLAADGAAPDGGTCISPVVTISLACDECTNTFCCTAWDGCFQDAECSALNACYQTCED